MTVNERPDGPSITEGIRLQKVLANVGMGSRRKAEQWIEEGRVTLDGEIANLGDRYAAGQRLCLDGDVIAVQKTNRVRVLLYHKSAGEICSREDPSGRETVYSRLPRLRAGRWISVGRLDYNTSGLLIFATDGDLVNALMHPASRIEREYLVRVMGAVDESMMQRLQLGVNLDDGPARFSDIQEGGGHGINRFYYVVLMEGRNREVRRLWESQGVKVSRLKRVRFGEVFLPSKLKKGQWSELGQREVDIIYRMAGLTKKKIVSVGKKGRDRQDRIAKKTAARQEFRRLKRPNR